MTNELAAPCAADLAAFLDAKLFGKDLPIEKIVPIRLLEPHALSFAVHYDEQSVELMNRHPESLVICAPDYKGRVKASLILSDHPRLDFLRCLDRFFSPERETGIDPTAVVHPRAALGERVSIGAHSVVGSDVQIGDDTRICHHVVLDGKVTIGSHCVIKSNAVIGEEGFGFAYDEFGVPMHFPHIGSIEIGDRVWIGACSTVERATIHKTILETNVKIDDLVQVGHNCRIGAGTLIMASSVICGGAVVGSGCWLAPNTTVKEKVRVGDRAYTGLGSVIIEDVPDNVVVVGNPAKVLRTRA